MAIPGLIEDFSGWKEVVDPDFQAPDTTFWSRLLKKRPTTAPYPSIKPTDFINPSIAKSADTFVNATKTILTSDTVATGGLGDPQDIQFLLTRQLYSRLQAMLVVDDAFVEIEGVETGTAKNAAEVARKMRTLATETLETSVTNPTREIEDLANQVTLRDMQDRLPQLSEKLGDDNLGGQQLDNLDFLAARLKALCELETSIR